MTIFNIFSYFNSNQQQISENEREKRQIIFEKKEADNEQAFFTQIQTLDLPLTKKEFNISIIGPTIATPEEKVGINSQVAKTFQERVQNDALLRIKQESVNRESLRSWLSELKGKHSVLRGVDQRGFHFVVFALRNESKSARLGEDDDIVILVHRSLIPGFRLAVSHTMSNCITIRKVWSQLIPIIQTGSGKLTIENIVDGTVTQESFKLITEQK